MKIFPLIKNFNESNIFNAFFLVSILQTIIISLTLLSRDIIIQENHNNNIKFVFTLVIGFCVTLISLFLMYFVFGYGKGMLVVI